MYRFNSPGAALLSAQFEVVGGWNGAMVKKLCRTTSGSVL
jgi:hypothetical protein